MEKNLPTLTGRNKQLLSVTKSNLAILTKILPSNTTIDLELWWESLSQEWQQIFLFVLNIKDKEFNLNRCCFLDKLSKLSTLMIDFDDDLGMTINNSVVGSIECSENIDLDLEWLSSPTLSPLEDIYSLSKLTELRELSLGNQYISDISPLKNLTKLTNLILILNDISDVSALENLTKLTNLILILNDISDVSALENLTKLKELNLAWNRIANIKSLVNILKKLTMLETLDLQNLNNEAYKKNSGYFSFRRIISINKFEISRSKYE